MTSADVLPPFEDADQTPDGEHALVYRFKPEDEIMWVISHDWATLQELIVDTEDATFLVERVAKTREEYEALRDREVRFDGW